MSLSQLVRDRMQRRRPWKQSMAWVAGVTDDPPGFPHAPPGVDVLEGGKLTYSVSSSLHNPLQRFAIAAGAVSILGSDAAGTAKKTFFMSYWISFVQTVLFWTDLLKTVIHSGTIQVIWSSL